MTANGTDISDGESLSGSQVLRVYGDNLTPPYFSLWFNGVEYTPLDYGDGYVEYVLQDNGTCEIRNERNVVMEFEIEGNVMPNWLPTRILAFQKNNTGTTAAAGSYINDIVVDDVNCINYAYKVNSGYPNYLFIFKHESQLEDLFTFENCVVNTRSLTATESRFNVKVSDVSKPAYITYQGFIIAVFNYTTTP